MKWTYIGTAAYIALLILVCLRIIYETRSTNKTLAYLLFSLFIPGLGMLFYIVFGINYWRRKRYNKKSARDIEILAKIQKNSQYFSATSLHPTDDAVKQNAELATMLIRDLGSPITSGNKVTLLVNGEEKFPDLLRSIRDAKDHIHIEYYIYDYDEIGKQVIEALIERAREGVQIKFIYDDFGSPGIKSKTENEMRDVGIEIFPFHKVHFYLLANRINYRNHRKIVVIDGHTGYVGGINVSDKYVNSGDKKKLFWRDTHIRLNGPAVYYLQYLFMSDWNFCCEHPFEPLDRYFPKMAPQKVDNFVQVSASGPDSSQPSVLYSILQAIYLAKEEILITTPYFIPGDSIIDALRVAALSGLKVKLLVPGICDSKIVNAASRSNYKDLLNAGVEIYVYNKGFVHAKTLVTDGKLFIVGTANMDYRSFDLNFEVNAIVYDVEMSQKMRAIFFQDLEVSEQLNKEEWARRKWYTQFPERICRLFSPVL
ncbi:MAG: cardiolipin synthase [Chitinophagaceae bacterium]|nr:MAG: cardiolipin synthase [Chitinophagaceae bacterium]